MKRKICAKKNSIIKIFTEKKIVEKKTSRKKKSINILKIILAIFLYLKTNSVDSRLVFETKN